MADRLPDDREDEVRPAARSRRSGLDRLRATRGESDPVEDTTAADADSIDGDSTDAGAGDTRSRGSTAVRSTALLESPARGDDVDDGLADGGLTDADEASRDGDPDAADAEQKATSAKRPRRTGRGGSTADESAGKRSSRRVGLPGRRSTPDRKGAVAPPAAAVQRRAIAAVLLAVLVVGLLIPAVLMRHRIVGQTSEEKAVSNLVTKRDEALGVARRFSVTFLSPDYKTIDDYNNQVAAGTTGQFNKDFVAKQGEVKSLLTRAQSQATGRVLSAGVSKVSGNDVEVLVVADQDVKTIVSQGKTVTNRYRVRVAVQKTDKGWTVVNFEPVT